MRAMRITLVCMMWISWTYGQPVGNSDNIATSPAPAEAISNATEFTNGNLSQQARSGYAGATICVFTMAGVASSEGSCFSTRCRNRSPEILSRTVSDGCRNSGSRWKSVLLSFMGCTQCIFMLYYMACTTDSYFGVHYILIQQNMKIVPLVYWCPSEACEVASSFVVEGRRALGGLRTFEHCLDLS